MAVKFAFEKIGPSFFGLVYRPVAQISLQSPSQKTWIETWMVVDTGADFTILPRYLSEDLGISLENDCIKDTTFGVGGQQTLYLCKSKIVAKVGNLERQIPLAFLDSNEVPALMGRLGFLETFDTQFLKSHLTVFND
jgi:predicted aspartyl protease